MSEYQMRDVRVSRIETITAQVKRFTLTATSDEPLPAFTGGSHIIVQMQDGDNLYSNAYSLISSPRDTRAYQIAVRLEEASKGGSRYLHQNVKPGDTLTISTPNNLFALAPQAQKHLLIAGGIGITPFLSQIPELEHAQAQWQLHYCSPGRDNCAFHDELVQHPSAARIHLHLSSAGTRLDLARLLADVEPGTHIYTCGLRFSTMPSEKPLPASGWTTIRYILNNSPRKTKAVTPSPWFWRVPGANLWSRKR